MKDSRLFYHSYRHLAALNYCALTGYIRSMFLNLMPPCLVLVSAILVPKMVAAAPDSDTKALSAAWARDGRPLPEPEFLQPRLDKNLRAYAPCSAESLHGFLEGSVPAILPKLVQGWLAAFHARQPGVHISAPPPYLAPQGALSAPMQKFLDGGSDFAFVSRDMTPPDVASFRRTHGVAPQVIPVVGGAWRHFGFLDPIGVVVNEANPIRELTLVQLDAVFSRSRLRGHGEVRTWGDLGVTDWADKPVHVLGAASWQGTEESARASVIHERVLNVGPMQGQWRDDVMAKGTEADVPGQVASDPYAIGFTGMGHLVAGIKVVSLAQDTGVPSVDASYENVALARYPLSRVAYIVPTRAPNRAMDPALREFVRFILSRDGQQIVLDQGVMLPLRAAQVDDARRLLGVDGDLNGCGPVVGALGTRR